MQLENNALGLGQHPALIVVDASYGFTDLASPLAADFSAEIAIIAQMVALARAQKWDIYFSTVAYTHSQRAATDGTTNVFREKLPALNILEHDSRWVAIDSASGYQQGDALIVKTHASCFHQTDFARQLGDADSLIVVGFTTSGCVRATAVDGLQHNLRTTIISDGVGDRDKAAHFANLHDFAAKYGDVVDFKDFTAQLKNI